jgi:hypothetical protein
MCDTQRKLCVCVCVVLKAACARVWLTASVHAARIHILTHHTNIQVTHIMSHAVSTPVPHTCAAVLCLAQGCVDGLDHGVVMSEGVKLIVEHRLQCVSLCDVRRVTCDG